MTLIFFRCAHCGKLYEHARISCLWCSSPIKRIELSGDDYDVWDLNTKDIKAAHRLARIELEECQARGIEIVE